MIENNPLQPIKSSLNSIQEITKSAGNPTLRLGKVCTHW
ncbi:hypothetical protein LPE509_01117 [Legionella pneumophila subsp. pneumophila LPE509]|nr:hypothetical protein LPE509_01117 [Legionella pneumophila subsp. pneumophila LPE509]